MKIHLSLVHWVVIILISTIALSMAGVAWWYATSRGKEKITHNTNQSTSRSINSASNINISVNNYTNDFFEKVTSNANTLIAADTGTTAAEKVNTNFNSDLTVNTIVGSENDWEVITYNKNNLSFSISIPTDWEEMVYLYDPPRERYSLIQYSWSAESEATQYLEVMVRYFINDDLSLSEWVQKHEIHLREGEQNHNRLKELSLSETVINGELAYVYYANYQRNIGEWDDSGGFIGLKVEDKSYKIINFENNKVIYQIYIGGDSSLMMSNEDIIDRIINSFEI